MGKKPTIFEFTRYEFDPEKRQILLHYQQEFIGEPPMAFAETILLPKAVNMSHIPHELLNKLLEGLHLSCGTSYYKFYCATKVKIPYTLSKEEADFWNAIYQDGLGEFYFRNKLNINKSPKFPYDKKVITIPFDVNKNNKCLLGISGGKDSIVAFELLKEQGIEVATIFTETNRRSALVDDVSREIGVEFLKVQRFLDAKVFEKHRYDGHIPISMIYAFLGVFNAVLYGYSYVVVANEYSSNFGNIRYQGHLINHQWSKSSEFENLFSEYVGRVISPEITYFSLVRPFYEIRIAELFSHYQKYFSHFSSCNKNFTLVHQERAGLWCGECPKCAFVFTLLSAFLSKKELVDIFNKNLYEDGNLLPLFKDILGLGKIKPFDCVGTFEESKEAFLLGAPKFKNDFMMKALLPKIKVNKKMSEELFRAHKSDNIPTQFRLLGMKNALILGYGREGEGSKKYIERRYPNLKIGVADKKEGRGYLKKQKDYDLAIRTAGMPKELVTIPYITATNLFFSRIKELGNTVIGVTGSKGKSTTASLIYAMVQEGGKKARLVGNIGNPMLEALLTPIGKEEIFVVELSSYQLDDIAFSPNIAVVTNLFPEHMDFHNGLKNYYAAKKNIIKFQSGKDIFVADAKNKKLSLWVKESKGKVVPFYDDGFVKNIKILLAGEHNKNNILASVAVAKELNVSDADIKNAIEKFKPLPHRLELVGEFNGIAFYDDAISTSPESTIEAIKSLKNIGTIFLGGHDRGYDFLQLEKALKKYKIKNAVLFPDSGRRIKLKGVHILKTKSMEEAVAFAYKNTEKGSVCLLSCASPSYSLWKNFEEKGEQFQFFVKKLSHAKNEKAI